MDNSSLPGGQVRRFSLVQQKPQTCRWGVTVEKVMQRSLSGLRTILMVCLVTLPSLTDAADLTLIKAGRVSIELLHAGVQDVETLSLRSASDKNGQPLPLPILANKMGHGLDDMTKACRPAGGDGLSGTHLMTTYPGRSGCRIYLDADPTTTAIDPFAAGTVLSFELCVQNTEGGPCQHVWQSDQSGNADGASHLKITEVYPQIADYAGRVFMMRWEASMLNAGFPAAYDDLSAVLRIDMDDDGDGLWNDWESEGIDADGDGTIDLRPTGANRYRKDIYVEIDYMDCPDSLKPANTACHRPMDKAIGDVVAAYDISPVPNPVDPATGTARTGITLHVDIDEMIPHLDESFWDDGAASVDCSAPGADKHFVCEKKKWFGTSMQRAAPAALAAKRFFYHYSLWAHDYNNSGGASGISETPGNDILITLGTNQYGLNAAGNHHVGNRRQQAGTFMHELGHNLGLRHGGGDDINYKPNYLSVMNYQWQFGWIPNVNYPTNRLDYSRQKLLTLDETSLVEVNGVLGYGGNRLVPAVPGDQTKWCTQNPGPNGTLFGWKQGDISGKQQACGSTVNPTADVNAHWLNWDFSFVPSGGQIVQTAECSVITVDLNGGNDPASWGKCNGNTNKGTERLTGFDDWASLVYISQATPNHEDGLSAQPIGYQHVGWAEHVKALECPEELDCEPLSRKYWSQRCAENELGEVLDNVAACVSQLSSFASESFKTQDELCQIYQESASGNVCDEARAELLTLGLNLCAGKLHDCCSYQHERGPSEGYIHDVVTDVELLLAGGSSPHTACKSVTAIISKINNSPKLLKTRDALYDVPRKLR